jgi:hypothetical protein
VVGYWLECCPGIPEAGIKVTNFVTGLTNFIKMSCINKIRRMSCIKKLSVASLGGVKPQGWMCLNGTGKLSAAVTVFYLKITTDMLEIIPYFP